MTRALESERAELMALADDVPQITMSDIRLMAGEGMLSSDDVLNAANAHLRTQWRHLTARLAAAPPQHAPSVAEDNPQRGLTDLERTLLIAAKAAQNYIANTESELGIRLASGDLLRSAIAKADSCTFKCCKGLAPPQECGCALASLSAPSPVRGDASEQEAESAIRHLKTVIDAAENSNQAGENAVVRAAIATGWKRS